MTDPARVRAIKERHKDFAERYSPGPDWEPFNQTHQDRGYLLVALDDAARDADGWRIRCGDAETQAAALRERVAGLEGALRKRLHQTFDGWSLSRGGCPCRECADIRTTLGDQVMNISTREGA